MVQTTTALLFFVFLRTWHYFEFYHMETQVLLPPAAVLHTQLFISPTSSQAGGPEICSAAPALPLAVLTSANAVALVPALAPPGSIFICALDTATNHGDKQGRGPHGISCPLDVHPEVDPAGGGDTTKKRACMGMLKGSGVIAWCKQHGKGLAVQMRGLPYWSRCATLLTLV